jgi:hypothetical protein
LSQHVSVATLTSQRKEKTDLARPLCRKGHEKKNIIRRARPVTPRDHRPPPPRIGDRIFFVDSLYHETMLKRPRALNKRVFGGASDDVIDNPYGNKRLCYVAEDGTLTPVGPGAEVSTFVRGTSSVTVSDAVDGSATVRTGPHVEGESLTLEDTNSETVLSVFGNPTNRTARILLANRVTYNATEPIWETSVGSTGCVTEVQGLYEIRSQTGVTLAPDTGPVELGSIGNPIVRFPWLSQLRILATDSQNQITAIQLQTYISGTTNRVTVTPTGTAGAVILTIPDTYLTSLVNGTANQITVTNSGGGAITLSIPSNYLTSLGINAWNNITAFTPWVVVNHNALFSAAGSTDVTLPFNTNVSSDSGTYHSTSVNNSRFTQPVGTSGLWDVTVRLYIPDLITPSSGVGRIQAFIFLNGLRGAGDQRLGTAEQSNPQGVSTINIATKVLLTSGQYFEIAVWHNHNGARNLSMTGAENQNQVRAIVYGR